jgi:hypothetical protein
MGVGQWFVTGAFVTKILTLHGKSVKIALDH